MRWGVLCKSKCAPGGGRSTQCKVHFLATPVTRVIIHPDMVDFVLAVFMAVFDKCIPELCNGAPLWRRCSLVICRGVIR